MLRCASYACKLAAFQCRVFCMHAKDYSVLGNFCSIDSSASQSSHEMHARHGLGQVYCRIDTMMRVIFFSQIECHRVLKSAP